MGLTSIKVNNSSVIGVDNEPIAGSDNLINSGGLSEYINNLIPQVYENGEENDLVISDPNGSILAVFRDGLIKTKNFDSSIVTYANDETSDSDLSIKDDNNNALVVFKEGHIKTKNFDSEDNDIINNRIQYGLSSDARINFDNLLFSKVKLDDDTYERVRLLSTIRSEYPSEDYRIIRMPVIATFSNYVYVAYTAGKAINGEFADERTAGDIIMDIFDKATLTLQDTIVFLKPTSLMNNDYVIGAYPCFVNSENHLYLYNGWAVHETIAEWNTSAVYASLHSTTDGLTWSDNGVFLPNMFFGGDRGYIKDESIYLPVWASTFVESNDVWKAGFMKFDLTDMITPIEIQTFSDGKVNECSIYFDFNGDVVVNCRCESATKRVVKVFHKNEWLSYFADGMSAIKNTECYIQQKDNGRNLFRINCNPSSYNESGNGPRTNITIFGSTFYGKNYVPLIELTGNDEGGMPNMIIEDGIIYVCWENGSTAIKTAKVNISKNEKIKII